MSTCRFGASLAARIQEDDQRDEDGLLQLYDAASVHESLGPNHPLTIHALFELAVLNNDDDDACARMRELTKRIKERPGGVLGLYGMTTGLLNMVQEYWVQDWDMDWDKDPFMYSFCNFWAQWYEDEGVFCPWRATEAHTTAGRLCEVQDVAAKHFHRALMLCGIYDMCDGRFEWVCAQELLRHYAEAGQWEPATLVLQQVGKYLAFPHYDSTVYYRYVSILKDAVERWDANAVLEWTTPDCWHRLRLVTDSSPERSVVRAKTTGASGSGSSSPSTAGSTCTMDWDSTGSHAAREHAEAGELRQVSCACCVHVRGRLGDSLGKHIEGQHCWLVLR